MVAATALAAELKVLPLQSHQLKVFVQENASFIQSLRLLIGRFDDDIYSVFDIQKSLLMAEVACRCWYATISIQLTAKKNVLPIYYGDQSQIRKKVSNT